MGVERVQMIRKVLLTLKKMMSRYNSQSGISLHDGCLLFFPTDVYSNLSKLWELIVY